MDRKEHCEDETFLDGKQKMLPARPEKSTMFDMIRDLASDLEAFRAEVWQHTADGQKLMNKVEKSYTEVVDHAIR